MLILFDIDGTLLRTQGAGRLAMADAGRELFGQGFTLDGVDIAGRLDPLIFADALAACELGEADDHQDTFRSVYGRCLETRFAQDATATLLPGVASLVGELTDREVTLGLLTGNYPETGRLKIAHAGLDPDVFSIGAWGCDGSHRRDLPPVALARYEASSGRSVSSGQVVIIGDTPHDVDCAAANGCRCLAVATGSYQTADLEAAGADRVVEDLSDTPSVLQWILHAS